MNNFSTKSESFFQIMRQNEVYSQNKFFKKKILRVWILGFKSWTNTIFNHKVCIQSLEPGLGFLVECSQKSWFTKKNLTRFSQKNVILALKQTYTYFLPLFVNFLLIKDFGSLYIIKGGEIIKPLWQIRNDSNKIRIQR